MTTHTLPEVEVDAEFFAELEAVLREGETVEQFVEAAVRRAVDSRRVQRDFLARGEAAWLEYQRTGVSRPADDVMSDLQAMTARRRAQLDKK